MLILALMCLGAGRKIQTYRNARRRYCNSSCIAPIAPFHLSIGTVTWKENAPHLQVRWLSGSSLQVSFRAGLQPLSCNVHIVQPNQYNQNDKQRKRTERFASDLLLSYITNRKKPFRSLQRA
jgi:hypothetical protein